MREWLVVVTEFAVLVIDAIALLVVLWATGEAIVGGLRVAAGNRSGPARRAVWLTYSRWLVAALTFQLAADIIETSVTTDWHTIARMAAIAAIRTVLNVFLERDQAEIRERQRESERSGQGEAA
jgi:uncharacterized membrane protein